MHMQTQLIELSDREIEEVSGGTITVIGGTITNLSGSNGAGSVSVAILGQSASFGGANTVAAGTVAGPTNILIG
jgi:hypothetical protein